MARISAADVGGANVLAFLDILAWSELGENILAQSDDGYNVIVGSLLAATSFCTAPGAPSSAFTDSGGASFPKRKIWQP